MFYLTHKPERTQTIRKHQHLVLRIVRLAPLQHHEGIIH